MDESIDLPIQNAQEPNEGAHQPELQNMSPPPYTPTRLQIAFESTQSTEISSSQSSSKAHKDMLSQPPAAFSHRQRLQWLQARRETGLWAQCDSCSQWRYLQHVLDRHELPKKWYCSLNLDKSYANCSVPESPLRIRDEEDLIHSEYSAGSLVWARLPGWPWWPAMVDDSPDTEQFYWIDGFSDIPTHYNVVFFDAFDVTRSWVAPNNMKPYGPNKNTFKHVLKDSRYKKRLEVAVTQANNAEKLPLANRLAKFSFIARYRGSVNPPRKINKNDLKKYTAQLKRKYNIAFPEASGTDSEEETNNSTHKDVCAVRKNNVILVGTPKTKRAKVSKKCKEETVSSTKETVNYNNGEKSPDNDIIQIEEEPKTVSSTKETVNNNDKKSPYNDIIEIEEEPKTVPSTKETVNNNNDKKSPYNDIIEIVEEPKTVSSTKETVNNNDKKSPDNDIIEIEDEPKSPERKTNETHFDHVDGKVGQKENDDSEVFKQPISLLAQAGSTFGSAFPGASFDNDTSKTYIPESESESEYSESTIVCIKETVKTIRQHVVSPSSDDFDFQ